MNLFVGNLNPETTVTNLRKLFSEFGEIVSAKIIFDNATGMSRGFGFVEMADKFHAYDCIDNIDCTFFEGNIISVKEAKQNNAKPGQGGGKSFRPGGNRRPGGPGQRPGGAPRPGGYNPRPQGSYNPNRPPNNYSTPRPYDTPRPQENNINTPRPGLYDSDKFNSLEL